MRPAVCAHSSGPVVFSCDSGLAGLAYWLGRKARELVGQALGDGVVALRVLRGDGHRAHHDLGAVRLEQRDLLRRHLVGHHEHAAVAALGGDDGQPDTGVAAGRLHDRAARLEQPVALGGEDHLQCRAVLGRPAGVRGLHLHGQHAGDLFDLADAAQAHERRVPDQVDDRLGDRRARQAGIECHAQNCTPPTPSECLAHPSVSPVRVREPGFPGTTHSDGRNTRMVALGSSECFARPSARAGISRGQALGWPKHSDGVEPTSGLTVTPPR